MIPDTALEAIRDGVGIRETREPVPACRPILFSGPMVRALLAGTKTQTRRIAKFVEAIDDGEFHIHNAHGGLYGVSEADVPQDAIDYAPIAVGDRLWVREAWRTEVSGFDRLPPRDLTPGIVVLYDADAAWAVNKSTGKLRPSIFMPRWASRLTLTVTDVRVQRLRDISEDDARAEGAYVGKASGRVADNYVAMAIAGEWFTSARLWYADLWDRINGAGAWDANPWVAAYSFTVERRNIDEGRVNLADANNKKEPTL